MYSPSCQSVTKNSAVGKIAFSTAQRSVTATKATAVIRSARRNGKRRKVATQPAVQLVIVTARVAALPAVVAASPPSPAAIASIATIPSEPSR